MLSSHSSLSRSSSQRSLSRTWTCSHQTDGSGSGRLVWKFDQWCIHDEHVYQRCIDGVHLDLLPGWARAPSMAGAVG